MKIDLYNSGFLNFVEFNITGDNINYKRCDSESNYLGTSVFNIIQHCFEESNKTFDYFSGTRFNSRNLIVLRNKLAEEREVYENLNSAGELKSLISNRFEGEQFISDLYKDDRDWLNNFQAYRGLMTRLLNKLIGLTERCAFEERTLWVIGY